MIRTSFLQAASGLLAACVLFLVSGCGKPSSSPPPVSEMSSQTLNQATQFVAASKADCEALVKSVDIAIAHQDSGAFTALIDEDRMSDRILAGLDLDEEFRTGFLKGMREGGGLANLSNEIIGSIKQGGDYTFVRMVLYGEELRPMFRLALPDSGGMNYHELVVTVDDKKQPRIADIYVHLSGEELSQTIRRLVLPAVAEQNAGIMARLTGAESEFLKNVTAMQKINELQQTQQFQQAFNLFATLPAELQKDKTVLLTKLMVAQQIGETEYTNAIRDLERYFPNDSARDFRAIDLLAVQGQHEELIRTVDRLMGTIQDPYLNTLKVDALLAMNRPEDARKAIAEARASAPNRIDVYWIEVSVSLRLKDHAATAALLDEIEKKFGVEFNDITTIPDYADFAASEIGKEWMTRQAGEQTPAEPAATPGEASPEQ